MSNWTDWLQALGSWAQAGGTVGAIVYAFRLADRQRQIQLGEQREHSRLKARALALYIRPPVEDWLRRVNGSSSAFDGNREPMRIIEDFRLRAVFSAPTPLWEKISDLHILGPAGDEFLSAIATAHEGAEEMTSYVTGGGNGKAFVEKLKVHISNVSDHLTIAIRLVQSSIDHDVKRTRRSI